MLRIPVITHCLHALYKDASYSTGDLHPDQMCLYYTCKPTDYVEYRKAFLKAPFLKLPFDI